MSSIEYLLTQLNLIDSGQHGKKIIVSNYIDISVIEKAKAMHKEEITQTYSDGLGNGMHFERGDGSGKDLDEEEYYKKKFA